MAEQIRRRKFPIVGGGGGVWSLVHISDAALATVAAIERGKPGVYHVADDEPAPVRDWLPVLARALGAKPPRRVPGWLARLVAGKAAVDMMTRAPVTAAVRCRRCRGRSTAGSGWRGPGWPRCPRWRGAGGVRFHVTEVNGQPGAVAFDAQDRLVAVIGLDITDGQIQTIRAIVNPDKLRNFDRVGALGALVRAGRRPRRRLNR